MGEDVILLDWSMSAVRACVCGCVCERLTPNLVQRKRQSTRQNGAEKKMKKPQTAQYV